MTKSIREEKTFLNAFWKMKRRYNKVAVKKTLSIPGWLNYAAEKAGVIKRIYVVYSQTE